jgi:hypothetical protein
MNTVILLPNSTTGRRGPQRHPMLAAVTMPHSQLILAEVAGWVNRSRQDVRSPTTTSAESVSSMMGRMTLGEVDRNA